MRRAIITATLFALALVPMVVPATATAAEEAAKTAKAEEKMAEAATDNRDHIEVQHVLISFKGSLPGKDITRTLDEAKVLAGEILERARKGEDFGELVKEYTNDSFPGIYKMANTGVQKGQGEYSRSGMVKGFGDASFSLAVGDVGMADYDAQKSPYGWHIVKRLK